MEGKTQETAAAKAGMSVRSARKWQSGPLPSQAKPEHRWRTRPDPFDGVWEDEIEPLLRNDPTGKLNNDNYRLAFDKLRRPSSIPGGSARPSCGRCNDDCRIGSCMVRIRRCTSPRCPPGREAQFDFTHCAELKVPSPDSPTPTWFQLILSHSGWRYGGRRR